MLRTTGAAAVLVLALAVVVQAQPPWGPNALRGAAPTRRPTTWAHFREVNAARAQGDAPALVRMNPALEAAAHTFARDYWNNWVCNKEACDKFRNGIGSDGSTPADRVQRASGSAKLCGVQQLVMTPGAGGGSTTLPSLSEMLKISMEDAGKQAVIMTPKATDMGLGILSNNDFTFYVLLLAHPC